MLCIAWVITVMTYAYGTTRTCCSKTTHCLLDINPLFSVKGDQLGIGQPLLFLKARSQHYDVHTL